jgi:hypothetical protein
MSEAAPYPEEVARAVRRLVLELFKSRPDQTLVDELTASVNEKVYIEDVKRATRAFQLAGRSTRHSTHFVFEDVPPPGAAATADVAATVEQMSHMNDVLLHQVQGVAPGVRSLVLPSVITLLRFAIHSASIASAAMGAHILAYSTSVGLLPHAGAGVGAMRGAWLLGAAAVGAAVMAVDSGTNRRSGEPGRSFFGSNDYAAVRGRNRLHQVAYDQQRAAVLAAAGAHAAATAAARRTQLVPYQTALPGDRAHAVFRTI